MAPLAVVASAGRPALARPLRVEDTVGDLLDRPAFAGFAPLLLPWDNRLPDRAMPLAAMASPMPYHSHVDPAQAVGSLNRLADDAEAGLPVVLDIYGEAERHADPAKARTGLFFYRGQPGAPFAIVCPGGGFAYVGSLHEGFPHAVAINTAGYNAFVMRYRPGVGERAATEDLAAGLSTIFRQAGTRYRHDGLRVMGQSSGCTPCRQRWLLWQRGLRR